jgi:hypothetical protein
MKKQYTDEDIENTAIKMGLTAEIKAGGAIFVHTPFGGHWIISEYKKGYRLQHENYHIGGSCRRGTYHKHNKIFADPFVALNYIRSHDSNKPFRNPCYTANA